MLKVCNVEKAYSHNSVLKQVSFELHKGEIVGLLGINGAGKSTLMNIISGCLEKTAGDILYGDGTIPFNSKEYKAHIGYVPEVPPLYQHMTVYEQLQFICEVKGAADAKTEIEKVCTALNMSDVKKRVIKNLSKGYKQRIGIAQGLIGNPELLILDEPAAGLDPQQIIDVRNLLGSLRKDHAILISSHILSEMMTMCTRLIIIHKGSIVAMGTPAELITEYGTKNLIELEVQGDMTDLKQFEEIHGVVGVECITATQSDFTHIMIQAQEGIDIRPSIFSLCSSRNVPIITLFQRSDSLEDVFMNFVR